MALRISRVLCILGRPVGVGVGRRGSRKVHSASERSVWHAFSCSVSYRASASVPLFRRFLDEVRLGSNPTRWGAVLNVLLGCTRSSMGKRLFALRRKGAMIAVLSGVPDRGDAGGLRALLAFARVLAR
jgi:hypothetical protein